ncbi:MAG: co-chaperone GroES [Melioribacteraceae bacterium]|nr:co-chaperone GroES [Melioribacteraceae bacterium]
MVSTKNIIVVGDRVLIKPEDDLEKTNSGLYLPPGVKQKEKVQGGYIIKVGPGYPVAPESEDETWKEKGSQKYISLQAKEGDFALYLRKEAVELELDGQQLIIVPQNAILLLHRDEDLLNF